MFDWTLGIIETAGYAGLFWLMVLENIFPPIPSELIVPFAGYAAAEGKLDPLLAIGVASLGALLGALPWYLLGRCFNIARLKRLSRSHGRWLTVTPADIDAADAWFVRYGVLAVFFGRLVPTVRTLISIPAGIARMPLPAFLAYSFAGSLLWTGFLISLGYVLQSRYEEVAAYLNPFSNLVVLLIIGAYAYRVAAFKGE